MFKIIDRLGAHRLDVKSTFRQVDQPVLHAGRDPADRGEQGTLERVHVERRPPDTRSGWWSEPGPGTGAAGRPASNATATVGVADSERAGQLRLVGEQTGVAGDG
jgi:hypothetical protein